jgi:hypothetical protein
MSSRPLTITLILTVMAFIAGLYWLRGQRPEAVKTATVEATPGRIAVAPQPTTSPRERATIRTETAIEPVDENQITGQQAKAMAARYRELAKFPKTSRPLVDGVDPIARGRSPKVDDKREPNDPTPHLIVYPSNASFEAPDAVVIYAELVEIQPQNVPDDPRGDRAPKQHHVRVAAREIRGEIIAANGVPVTAITFRDDGTNGDAQAEDLFYTATYTPDPDKPKAFRGAFEVNAMAISPDSDTLSATNAFTYTVQIAHLTGSYRDSLVEGNLQIDAEVEVEEPGRFYLEGTLVTAADAKMVGYAYADTELPAGRAWVPLTFYGLMFHQMKAKGPYQLFSVTLATVEDGVPQHADVVPAAHTTGLYEISQFTEAPFNEPERMRMAEHFDGIARAEGE